MTKKTISELIDEAMEHVPERVISDAEKYGTNIVIGEDDGTIKEITPDEARERLKKNREKKNL